MHCVTTVFSTFGLGEIIVENDSGIGTALIFELYRLGINKDAIRKVILENPRDVFGFSK